MKVEKRGHIGGTFWYKSRNRFWWWITKKVKQLKPVNGSDICKENRRKAGNR